MVDKPKPQGILLINLSSRGQSPGGGLILVILLGEDLRMHKAPPLAIIIYADPTKKLTHKAILT